MKLLSTLKNYDKANLPHDFLAGIIIAAVSIPISMGYAQIAGLPPEYGLYGSLLPILCFAIFSTSPQMIFGVDATGLPPEYGLYGSLLPILCFAIFSTSPQMIFGVDATPAALVGAAILGMNVVAGSQEAQAIIPVITFFTALWLLLFAFLKAGKLIRYISEPVMGGFLSGIAVTIIMMQLPKLFGGEAGTGEFFELYVHLYSLMPKTNLPSLALGVGSLAIILLGKKVNPKLPMAVFVMVVGALAQMFFHLNQYGIALLPAVPSGLPHLSMVRFDTISNFSPVLGQSLTIALVIMAESLLSSNNFATKNGDVLNDNQEILAYSLGNFCAAFTGCCPTNGSVSRMVMGEQFGGRSQLMGIVAGLSMAAVLLFGTNFIAFLPVPVLTAIVISALLGVIEFDLAKTLYRCDKKEFRIFMGAFIGVLALGTIYGVIIGVILSFASLLQEAADPQREFMGIVPGHKHFYSLLRNPNARAVEGVVIYRFSSNLFFANNRFSSNLFFANIEVFEREIKAAIQEDTKVVVADAGGISSIDLTSAKHISQLYHQLKDQGIAFYMTEHIGLLNDQFRAYGYRDLLEAGMVRRATANALADAGYQRPYTLVGGEFDLPDLPHLDEKRIKNEFKWVYGDEAEAEMEKHTEKLIAQVIPEGDADLPLKEALQDSDHWSNLSTVDEQELLTQLEFNISELGEDGEAHPSSQESPVSPTPETTADKMPRLHQLGALIKSESKKLPDLKKLSHRVRRKK